MEPTQLASTISTLQGLITGAVGCTILSVIANITLWRRLTKVEEESKSGLADLTKACTEEMKLTRDMNGELRHVLEAILVEMRRQNGVPVEPSIPGLRKA